MRRKEQEEEQMKIEVTGETEKVEVKKKKRWVLIQILYFSQGIEALEVKLLTPSRAIDALIGDEEQNGKQKKGKKVKETGSGPLIPWIIWSPLTTLMDHTLDLF